MRISDWSSDVCSSDLLEAADMAFTDIFIRRPILAIVVSLLILLVGVSATFSLPVRQYPRMESATITIDTAFPGATQDVMQGRSEEHTSELQSLMSISYAVSCLKKKTRYIQTQT